MHNMYLFSPKDQDEFKRTLAHLNVKQFEVFFIIVLIQMIGYQEDFKKTKP